MTNAALQSTLDRVLTWALERQIEAARMLETIERSDSHPFALSGDQIAGIKAALAAADRGEFASDSEVQALWAK